VHVRARRFAFLVVPPRGYKAGDRPYVDLRPFAQTPVNSLPPSLRLKREREKDREI
jgi:hypothetical protein